MRFWRKPCSEARKGKERTAAMEKKYYEMNIVGCIRKLPIIRISDNLDIASFVLLGDAELVVKAAAALKERVPEVDYLITAEAKGIPLGTAIAFMMAVVGLSLPEATLLKKVMTWRLIGIFFGTVAGFIILSGYLFNRLL